MEGSPNQDAAPSDPSKSSDRLPAQMVLELPKDKTVSELLKDEGFGIQELEDVLEILGLMAYKSSLLMAVEFKIGNFPSTAKTMIALSKCIEYIRANKAAIMNPPSAMYALPGVQDADVKKKSLSELSGGSVDDFLIKLVARGAEEAPLQLVKGFWYSPLSEFKKEAPLAYKRAVDLLKEQGRILVSHPEEMKEAVREDVAKVIEKSEPLSIVDTHHKGLTSADLLAFMEAQKKAKEEEKNVQ